MPQKPSPNLSSLGIENIRDFVTMETVDTETSQLSVPIRANQDAERDSFDRDWVWSGHIVVFEMHEELRMESYLKKGFLCCFIKNHT